MTVYFSSSFHILLVCFYIYVCTGVIWQRLNCVGMRSKEGRKKSGVWGGDAGSVADLARRRTAIRRVQRTGAPINLQPTAQPDMLYITRPKRRDVRELRSLTARGKERYTMKKRKVERVKKKKDYRQRKRFDSHTCIYPPYMWKKFWLDADRNEIVCGSIQVFAFKVCI